MSVEIVVLAVFCAVLLGTVFSLLKRHNDQKVVLEDARSRLESGRVGYNSLHGELKQNTKKMASLKTVQKDMEATLAEARNRFSKEALLHEAEIERFKADSRTKALREEHLVEENAILKEQLTEKDQEIKGQSEAFQKELADKVRSQANQKEQKAKQAQETTNNKDAKEIAQLTKRVQRLTAILKKVDPGENRKNKRKAKQMEQLYNSMKGLKELTEERNNNWEVALAKLSNHVLGRAQGSKGNIGDTVGSALEKIGTRKLNRI